MTTLGNKNATGPPQPIVPAITKVPATIAELVRKQSSRNGIDTATRRVTHNVKPLTIAAEIP
jgi:hypothetical protein